GALVHGAPRCTLHQVHAAPCTRARHAHSPFFISGSLAPPRPTPSTSIAPDPIMKSTWIALLLPPAFANASSSIVSPPASVNLYAVPSATWLAAFSSNSVL